MVEIFEMIDFVDRTPQHMEHVMVSDGYFYQSGHWIIDLKGKGMFVKDCDKFSILFWYPLDERIREND